MATVGDPRLSELRWGNGDVLGIAVIDWLEKHVGKRIMVEPGGSRPETPIWSKDAEYWHQDGDEDYALRAAWLEDIHEEAKP